MKYVYYDKYYNTITIRAALARLFVAATISAKNVLFANRNVFSSNQLGITIYCDIYCDTGGCYEFRTRKWNS